MSRLHEALTAIGRSAPRVLARTEPPPPLIPARARRRGAIVPVLGAVSVLGVVSVVSWVHPLPRIWHEPPSVTPVVTPSPLPPAPAVEPPARRPPAIADFRSRARLAATLGALDEAHDLLEQALRLDQADAETWNDLGVVLIRRGERQRGVEAFERSLRLDARRADTHRNLAVALEQNGSVAKAAKHYRAFLALAPAHPERYRVERRLAASMPDEEPR